VSRLLYQLHLLTDRRQQRTALFAAPPADAAAAAAESEPRGGEPPEERPAQPVAVQPLALTELQGSLRQSIQQLVRDQLAEQRRFMLATFEAFARRLGTEIKEGVPKASPPPVEPLELPPPPRQWWPVLLTALLAVLPAAVFGVLYWRALESNREFAKEIAEVRTAVEKAARAARRPVTAPAAAPAAAVASSGSAAAPIAIEYVPYGETPLAGARLERLRGLAGMLEAQRFRGRLVAESYVGDFCLAGNPAEGFAVAPPELPLQKCDIVGNPFDDVLSPAQRQSLDYANFVATLRQRTGGAIEVVAVNAGRRRPVAYPEQGEGTTAGAWNTAAAQNNRVEFRLVPAAD
jgi:hypothetical protein